MGTSHPKVVVIDRNRLFADCLGVVLEMRRYVLVQVPMPAGCAHTEQVLDDALAARAVVAVIDADLTPKYDVGALVRSLAAGGAAVVVLTARADEARQGGWLAAGARIVVPRSASLPVLVSIIRRLSRNERVLEVGERERLLAMFRRRSERARESNGRLGLLSTHEGEVLSHLMAGLTVREIAELRAVSEATVRTQVKSILHKLGVGSQLTAVAMGHRAGWVPMPVPAAS